MALPSKPGTLIALALLTVPFAGCLELFFGDHDEDVSQTAPAISFVADESNDRTTIMNAASGADWARIAVQADSCTVSPPAAVAIMAGSGSSTTARPNTESGPSGAALNSPRSGSTCGPSARRPTATAPDKMAAGDFLDFCAASATSTAMVRDVKLTFFDVNANAVIYVYTFDQIAPCTG